VIDDGKNQQLEYDIFYIKVIFPLPKTHSLPFPFSCFVYFGTNDIEKRRRRKRISSPYMRGGISSWCKRIRNFKHARRSNPLGFG